LLGRYLFPIQSGARLAPQIRSRTPDSGLQFSPLTWALVTSSLQYLLGQSNQVREDIRHLHWALCSTGANRHIAYKGIKGGIVIYFFHSLSLCLSSFFRHLTDLTVGGDFAGQLLAGLCYFAGQDTDERTSLMMPRHRTKIASTIINAKISTLIFTVVKFKMLIKHMWVLSCMLNKIRTLEG
jgi:hypothetical protein